MTQAQALFDEIINGRRVSTVFQPIAELASGRIVGYEALTRGPWGSRFEQPARLFAHAYETGRVAELDWVCRAAAFRSALEADMPYDFALFVNAEPTSLGTDCPPDLLDTILTGFRRFKVVVELTERQLAENPAKVLHAVAVARAQGLGIAIDDMGAEPASVAMLPLVRPDVIKLDLSLIQQRPDLEIARTVNGVLAEVERTGAIVVAEGIETSQHAVMAHALGCTWGQGWRYGRPERLPDTWPSMDSRPMRVRRPSAATMMTPFDLVAHQRPTRIGDRDRLRSLSRQLEHRAADPREPGVLVACFEDLRYFGPRIADRYQRLAGDALLVATFAVGMPAEPRPGVRGTALRAGDPLAQEWVVAVVGANFGGALVARRPRVIRPVLAVESPPLRTDDIRYEFAITYERELVIAVAQNLMQRIDAPLLSTPVLVDITRIGDSQAIGPL